MHPRNRHLNRYDFLELKRFEPELAKFSIPLKGGEESIDFTNPEAVKILNRSLLKAYYNLRYWDIPHSFLCPPIPGRVDYIHNVADLLDRSSKKKVIVLDIGVGANCIYPLTGHAEYGWNFVGSDVNPKALEAAQKNIDENDLNQSISLRFQGKTSHFFQGIVQEGEYFDLSICNPPFHSSLEEARAGTARKWKNLGKNGSLKNFGGQGQELWCSGGEKAFIEGLMKESALFRKQFGWFTTLVSKQDSLPLLRKLATKLKCRESKILEMAQGQKTSRAFCWRF